MADKDVLETVSAPIQTPGKAKKIRGSIELVKAAWEIFKACWKKTSVIYGGILVGTLVITMATVAPLAGWLLQNMDNASVGWPKLSTNDIALLVGGALIFVVFAVIFGLALSRSILATGSGKAESVRDSLKFSFSNFFPFLGVSIAAGFVVGLGFLLLVVPGVIFALMFSQIAPIYVLENVRGLDVLRRSADLTKGYRWAILGRLVLMAVALGIFSSILSYIPVVGFVVPFVTTPLAMAYSYSIYKDLVAIKG